MSDVATMKAASDMLGCGDVQELLEKRSITVGGETTKIDLNPQQALLSRDAVVKIVYARLFSFVVSRMNRTTQKQELALTLALALALALTLTLTLTLTLP